MCVETEGHGVLGGSSRVNEQWLRDWFPVVGLLSQVVFWMVFMDLHASSKTRALVTFTSDPKDPEW